jgi:hypothetical protein
MVGRHVDEIEDDSFGGRQPTIGCDCPGCEVDARGDRQTEGDPENGPRGFKTEVRREQEDEQEKSGFD